MVWGKVNTYRRLKSQDDKFVVDRNDGAFAGAGVSLPGKEAGKTRKRIPIARDMLYLLLLFPFVLLYPASAFSQAEFPLPDTGQTQCYDMDGNNIYCPLLLQDLYGQDACYPGSFPSYQKLDADGKTLKGTATSWSMVRDMNTGLIWEVKTRDTDQYHGYQKLFSWEGAHQVIIHCNNTNFGGANNWRLPTVKELESLFILEGYYPKIQTLYFPNTGGLYWSDTLSVNYASQAWYASFTDGMVNCANKGYEFLVRAVRTEEPIPNPELEVYDQVVVDPVSGLMWQRYAAPGTYDWGEALDYCKDLELEGYSDWRLPNRRELLSIADYTNSCSSESSIFPGGGYFFSSTTNQGATWEAMCTYFCTGSFTGRLSGSVMGLPKTEKNFVRAVRDALPEGDGELVPLGSSRDSSFGGDTASYTGHNNESQTCFVESLHLPEAR